MCNKKKSAGFSENVGWDIHKYGTELQVYVGGKEQCGVSFLWASDV